MAAPPKKAGSDDKGKSKYPPFIQKNIDKKKAAAKKPPAAKKK